MTITPYHSIHDLINNYDGFIIDLWGVIHDGQNKYPGVNECLETLKEANKTIIFLSNAPRRASVAKTKMDQLYIPNTLYDAIITSGEAVHRWAMSTPFPDGAHYAVIGPEKDETLLDTITCYTRTENINKADFLVATGFDNDFSELTEKKHQTDIGLRRNLPLICANPDKVVVRLNGTRVPCAGIIAEQYEQQGGTVHYFGKPYPDVYEYCFEIFATHNITNKQRIIAIGDNLETDIKGANNQSLTSILIASGILAEQLHIKHGEMPNTATLETLCKQQEIIPNGILPAFVI